MFFYFVNYDIYIYMYLWYICIYIYKIYRTSYPGHIILPVISIWYIELVGRNSRNYYRRGCRLLRLWIATLRIVPWEIRIIVGISMESSLGLAPMVKYLHEVRELHPPHFFDFQLSIWQLNETYQMLNESWIDHFITTIQLNLKMTSPSAGLTLTSAKWCVRT
jgi:hypothetical protein